jgi:hypothetical protein
MLAGLELSPAELELANKQQIAVEYRDTQAGRDLFAGLMARREVFGPLDPSKCTEQVEFTLITPDMPDPVSFRVQAPRGAKGAATEEGLNDWITKGICERVPWDTPAYGFALVVPKAGGKTRLVISPMAVNKAIKRLNPEGGYMPASMIREAQNVHTGAQAVANSIDLAEAFCTFKLGPQAQRLSTFTSPIGKIRFRHGYFGWHSFPAYFQRMVMEKIVLPTLDEHDGRQWHTRDVRHSLPDRAGRRCATHRVLLERMAGPTDPLDCAGQGVLCTVLDDHKDHAGALSFRASGGAVRQQEPRDGGGFSRRASHPLEDGHRKYRVCGERLDSGRVEHHRGLRVASGQP